MYIRLLYFWLTALTLTSTVFAQEKIEEEVLPDNNLVYFIPIEGAISEPQLYILRRAIKDAIENKIENIVIKMDTPGGDLATTLEMMEALDRFDGRTFTLVDNEAISAGSYIAAATDKIYMVPGSLIGAAAVIQSSGEDVPETIRLKIESYLKAKVRSISEEYPYRADVIRAMMDESFELEIDGVVLKEKGELLTLTANEAFTFYGDPPVPLLAAGVVDSVEELLRDEFGADHFEVINFDLTWAEKLAKYINAIASVLLGLGMLFLFIEFKTPGFGVFGVAGISLLLLVFLGKYVAGLAGYEGVFFLFLGIILLGTELFLFPGTIILGLIGIGLIFGSIIWTLADIWPGSDFEISPEIFIEPSLDFLISLGITIIGMVIFIKFLPKSWFWDKLILNKAQEDQKKEVSSKTRIQMERPEIGKRGIVVNPLFPSGSVDIDSKRYEAKAQNGVISKGEKVEVIGYDSFYIIVRKV